MSLMLFKGYSKLSFRVLVIGILIGGYLFGLFSKLSNKITHFQVVAHKGVSDLFQVITHGGVDDLLYVMLFNVTRSIFVGYKCQLYHVWISVKFTVWVLSFSQVKKELPCSRFSLVLLGFYIYMGTDSIVLKRMLFCHS